MSSGMSSADGAAKAPAPAPAPAAPAVKVIDNPALRMLGLPRLRRKLPSRNWMIFWTLLGGFTGTIWYDRRQKKIIQQKWCNAVSHLSAEPLPWIGMQRNITVYLAAPPGDTLRPVREQFHEYVKPILVAAGVDWDAVEGRKEGDLRAALAERIRKRRRKEIGAATEDEEDLVEAIRVQRGVETPDRRGGELIIGRHTWKEYVRGLHEGWLGPLQEPIVILDVETAESQEAPTDGADPPTEKTEKPKPKPKPTPSYIKPKDYAEVTASGIPAEFPITCVISNPHLLGFLKTPLRLARFLNRRALAEEQGREVVDMLLTTFPQSYEKNDDWEQKHLLEDEEPNYHKSARAPNPEGEENRERPWTENMVIDDRIGSRMRKVESVTVNSQEKGHLVDWKGGADTNEKMGWWKWLKWAFDVDYPEPKCKGWEDGLKGSETD